MIRIKVYLHDSMSHFDKYFKLFPMYLHDSDKDLNYF